MSKKPRGKLCQWTEYEMLRAIEYAPSGTVSIPEAARCYKIPPKALVSGRTVRRTKVGAKPCLTHEEEKEPVQLLINWAMVKQGRNEVVKHGTR